MADGDQTTQYLHTRIGELEKAKASLEVALRQARGERKTAVERSAELEGQVRTLSAERDEVKAQVERAPGEWQTKAQQLQAQLAERDVREAFRDRALAAGVKPEAIGDLFALSGLKPPAEGDLPPNHFDTFLAEAQTGRAWAFYESPTPAGQPGTSPAPAGQSGAAQGAPLVTPSVAPPPGAGRGGSDHSSTLSTFRRSEVGTPAWMQANQAKLAEATANGTARWVD
jgi:hypothetical protein